MGLKAGLLETDPGAEDPSTPGTLSPPNVVRPRRGRKKKPKIVPVSPFKVRFLEKVRRAPPPPHT
jgi:hypothetical protein